MTRLTLAGVADDGQSLWVTSEDGERYTLPVTDELRMALRHARVAAASQPAPTSGLSPKEIQQRIRSGLSAADLAELTGQPVEVLTKYEAPVLAERAYVAELARNTRIGREAGAPILGELVTDRLVSRGVAPDAIEWDAWREGSDPWHVCARYRTEGRGVEAVWTFDHLARSVTAQNPESRWLTETELMDVPIPARHLAAVRHEAAASNVRQLKAAAPAASPEQAGPNTDELLADLESKRGTRDVVDVEGADDDGGFEGFGPMAARTASVGFGERPPMPHPAGSARRTDAAPEAAAGAGEAASEPATAQQRATAEKKPVKKGRASVPSWDEIVFGAKGDDRG